MIVLTGANGFIGSFAVARLNERGRSDLIAVDRFSSLQGRGPTAAPCDDVRYLHDMHVARYMDMHDLPDWLDRTGCDIEAIIHLGACSDTTVTDRDWVMQVNYEYTRSLWSWCAKNSRPLIYASSAATYGDGSHGYDDQTDPSICQPLNLYGESKHRFDLWALKQTSAPPRWAGLKFFNVFGPYEAHKERMASVARHAFEQIRRTEQVRLFESHKPGVAHGQQMRDFIYVADAVDAALHFLDQPVSDLAPNGLYNIGTGQARSFADLAVAVFNALSIEPNVQYIPMPEDLRGKYQYFTQATIAKLRQAGYHKPFYSLEQGAAEYVAFLLKQEAVSA